MASMVGKDYSTGEAVTVAVDANGVVQVSSVALSSAASKTDLQRLEGKIDDLLAAVAQIQSALVVN